MKKSNGLGVAIGMSLWGVILFSFESLTGISGGLYWGLAIASLILLLFGVMGTCMELFGEEKRNA